MMTVRFSASASGQYLSGLLTVFALLLIFGPVSSTWAEDSHTPLEPIECPGKDLREGLDLCYILHLPTDWNDIANRSIEVPVIRLAPLEGGKALHPPVLILVGGPGQSAIWLEKRIAKNLEDLRKDRELIFMDQRGTGPFFEDLVCESALDEDGQVLLDKLESCAKAASDPKSSSGKDLRLSDYTTEAAARDYKALRYALQIDKWSIIASSYGARLAQRLLALDPKGVDRVVFNGPLFAQTRLLDWDPFPLIEAGIDACNQDEACRQDYPDLYWNFQGLPFEISRASLPEGAAPLGLQSFLYRQRLEKLLSRGQVNALPLDITKTFAAIRKANEEGTIWTPPPAIHTSMKGISLLMHFAVLCAEEIKPLDSIDLDDLKQPLKVAFYRQACHMLASLPHASQSPKKDWDKGEKSDRPVLVLSGAFDTNVEHETTNDILLLYPHSVWHNFPFAGHDVLSSRSCAHILTRAFLDGRAPDKLDTSCIDGLKPDFLKPKK